MCAAAFNEKLLLSNAMLIAPINTTKDGSVSHGRGLRDIIQSIDNNQDFNSHMLGSSANLPRPVDIRYEQHPSLSSQQAMPPTAFGQPPAGYGPTQSMPGAFNSPAPQYGSSTPQNNYKQGPQPQPQYPRQDNNISPMGQPGPQHQSPYGDTPQSAHTQQSPSQSQAPPYGAPTQSMDLPMQRPTNQGTPLPLQMKSARPPSGGPMGGPMGGSMSGQVGGPMGGPMGGPISGPMSGSTSGPVGGPMGVPMSNPIGSPISSNMGGPMGGSLGGPPGGLMDGQKSGLMGESAGPPVGGSTGSSLGRLTGPSMDEPTSQSMGGPSSGNIGGVMGAPMGIPMGAPQDAPSSGPTTGPMSRPYQDKSQARPMPGYKALSSQPPSSGLNHQGLPPTRPVFGQHLEVLFQRDEVAVPMIVQQCTIAVDLFGSQVEGIYRVSGSAPHIAALKELFDHGRSNRSEPKNVPTNHLVDSSRVDFRNPETFFHDVNSVAGLLKQFLRDLPDPLFTEAEYGGFINAAREYLTHRLPSDYVS